MSTTMCPPRCRHRARAALRVGSVALQSIGLVLFACVSLAADPTWQRVDAGGRPADPLIAVARSAQGDVAVGAGGVVRWWSDGLALAPARAALQGVRDLAFGPNGALWIGGATGLWRWAPGGRPERRPLRGDAGASDVARLVGGRAGLLVATRAGAYWSTTGRVFQPLAAGRVGASVTQVAFRVIDPSGDRRDPRELWLFGDEGLERLVGLATPSGLRLLRREGVPLPRPRSDAWPVDLAVAADGGPLLVLYGDAIAVGIGSPEAPEWRRVRPVLAPGAQARRLRWTEVGLLLATDRGLFEAAEATADWRRIGPDPGAQPCFDLDAGVTRRDGVALCQSGLHVLGAPAVAVAQQPPRASSPSLEPLAPIPPDPPVEAIRSRALARAGLGVDRDRALRKGLARRGWWPEVGLQLGADYDREDRRFADQAFVSGGHRALFDRTRERGTRFEAMLEFDWTLGEIAYPDDSVDLSRELRQVLSLRDDVSDEIHQLYFERARIRQRFAVGGPFEPGEAAKLRVRAEELAAGLDAWTGGWLSEWRVSPIATRAVLPASSPSPGPDPRGQPIE